MASTIIYKSSKREFCEIPIGEFFMLGGHLHVKVTAERAMDIHAKELKELAGWEETIEPRVTISVEF